MASDKNKRGKQTAAAALVRPGPNWPLFVLGVVGMILSGYLTVSAWQGTPAAFCAAGAGCDIVLNSRWATLFGVPTSLWGFLTYALLAAVAWNRDAANQWRWAWVISLFGLFFSLYLTAISFFELKAACPYCLTSLGLLATIFVLTTFQRPTNLPKFSWGPFLAKSVGAAAAVIVVLHLHYAGYLGKAAGPEDPWIRNLAEHLAKTDAKFYGASWCPHCTEQKHLFGSSEKRIPYVECSPGGPKAPQAQACKDKAIQSYPTWIINGERHTGVQSLDTLAQLSKFEYKVVKP
ncbi:MAG TPA: vitamin K epoxide reductase family protein [Candidatus Binatia bacterium]|nr:vitamin K epoxide reductase family protein [Candidatus Binatia bacterium]